MGDAKYSRPTPEQLVAELVLLFDLEPRGGDRFIGRQRQGATGRVFGGQAIAQALVAAQRTVDAGRDVHSLHAYFLRPGSDDRPIELRVKRDLDGRSFSNRRVVASQGGEPLLNLVCSFHAPLEAPSHQYPLMPQVPPPEELEPDASIARELAERMPEGTLRTLLTRPQPIDVRSVEPRNWLKSEKRDPVSHAWFKVIAPLPPGAAIHRAILAYISDFQLLGAALLPHGKSFLRGEVKAASLDHAMWFHGNFAVDDWLLYVTESPWSGNARGFGRGQVFARDGRLVASVAQEGMLRLL